MWLMHIIHGEVRNTVAEAPLDGMTERKVNSDDSDEDLRRYTSYRSDCLWSMGWAVEIMEDGITFGCSVVSLFSGWLVWIAARDNCRRCGFYPQSKNMVFPWALDGPKALHLTVAIGSRSYDFVQVHTQQECTILCCLSCGFPLYHLCSPGGMGSKEGDHATATRDWGRVTDILYSKHPARLRSLAIFLLIHLPTITQVHIWNHIILITIHMLIWPKGGVGSLTLVWVPSEPLVCYIPRRGCRYAVAVYTPPGYVYEFLQLIATFYLSSIAIYQMPHSPYTCFASHIALQSSLWIPFLPLHLLFHYCI